VNQGIAWIHGLGYDRRIKLNCLVSVRAEILLHRIGHVCDVNAAQKQTRIPSVKDDHSGVFSGAAHSGADDHERSGNNDDQYSQEELAQNEPWRHIAPSDLDSNDVNRRRA